MVQFSGFASLSLCIGLRIHIAVWVSPFGDPRIIACYQLPGAFRRFPRPSSPVVAKASTVCTYSLDHTTSSYLSVVLFSFTTLRLFQVLFLRLAPWNSSPVGYAEENISNNVLFFSATQFSCLNWMFPVVIDHCPKTTKNWTPCAPSVFLHQL